MKDSIILKSPIPSTLMGSQMFFPIGVRYVIWFAVLMLANLSSLTYAQSPCQGIHVKILNIRNSSGSIMCGLFESPDGFPTEFLRSATHIMITKVLDNQVSFGFQDIKPGTYALVAVHDENVDGKLDTNWLGIPKEGYGFSNNAKAFLRAPSFSTASFPYDGGNLDLTISLHY